jgi:hypothetical protein
VAVQSLNGAVGFLVAIDLNKAKPARLARKTVAHQGDVCGGDSRLGKECGELLFCSLKGQIADIKFLQRDTPSGRGKADPWNGGTEAGGIDIGREWAGAQNNPIRDALQFRANLALNFNVRQQKHLSITRQ